MKGLINGKIITEEEIVEDKVLVFDQKIKEIIPSQAVKEDIELIDVEGDYIAPGFIDLHIHGAGGKDTMDATKEALETIAETVAQSGVTGFLPTTMTMDQESIYKALANIQKAKVTKNSGAEVLGAHLEGPFINSDYKGAQPKEHIVEPSVEFIADYLDTINYITLAPEKDVEFEFIKKLRQQQEDIVLAIGHSDASYEQARQAINAGVNSITHLFNAMNSFHHRRPGILGAAFRTNAVAEVIADTVHVHQDLFQFLLDVKGTDELVLVTDSMRAGGLDPGEYELGGQKVIVDESSARLTDGTLAGSILTLNQAVYNFYQHTDLDLVKAVKLASLNPAQLLGIAEDRGSIVPGKKADLVVLDKEFEVNKTIVQGNVVYS